MTPNHIVPPESGYRAVPCVEALGARWSFLHGKPVFFVASGAAVVVRAGDEYVFYELTATCVLVLGKDELLAVLGDVAPDELTVRETPLGEAAALKAPLKVLGFASGDELAGLALAAGVVTVR